MNPLLSTIDSAGLAGRMTAADPPAMIDVRERGEYVRGHIPGATTLARGLVEVCVRDVLPGLRTPTILYCDDGDRSRMAAAMMRRLGYRDVAVLEGGFNAWRAMGGESQPGANVLGKAYAERLTIERELPELEPAEVESRAAAEPVLVIDVRSESEYASGHLPSAINVPGGELPATVAGLREAGDLPDTVIVHCAGRTRGLLAVDVIARMGVGNVFALRNGTMAWQLSGRELEVGSRDHRRPRPTAAARAFAARFADGLGLEARIRATSLADLEQARAEGVSTYLVDVRLPEEFTAGHITGAISIPSGQLSNTADEFVGHRCAPVVCYSNHQVRARMAADLLRRIGYPHATWLATGFADYLAAGLPVTSDTAKYGDAPVPGLRHARARTPVLAWDAIAGLRSPVLLDVRRSSEFAVGHLPGSVWVPRGDLERRVHAVCPDPVSPVVVVSNRDIRSALAAQTLRELGFTQVWRLAGGLRGSAAARPLVEGLDGAEVSLLEAKEDANLTGERGEILKPDHTDMQRYLDWEIRLGDPGRTRPKAPSADSTGGA